MARFNLICTRGVPLQIYIFSYNNNFYCCEMLTCSSSSSSTCISERENASSRAALRLCSRFSNAFGQLRTIATSLLQEEGEISHDIVLKLQSLDFGSAFGREDDAGRVHGLLPIHNLDLDRGNAACLG